MEHPNATWNEVSTHLINKDLSYQDCTSFLNDKELNKAQMASLGQELENLRTELKEHRLNALEGNQKSTDPNQKGRKNAERFCGCCRTNGHTPNYCRKKMRDEEVKKLENEATAGKKVTSTHDYNKRRGPSHGSGSWARRNDDNRTMMSTSDVLLEEISSQKIRTLTTSDKIDLSNEDTTRITRIIGILNTQQNHHTSRTKINLGVGEVTITIPRCLQRHDKIPPQTTPIKFA